MEKYQIIPRKFRPKQFSEVVGQDAIVTTIKNALKQKRLGQAYLFCGSRGCGKTTLARLFAKALHCENISKNFEPCHECISCIEISEGRSLDIIEIDGASNRGIDDIRHINETIGYAPNKGEYKIYIIDEVHMLTKEAFNALLKTLEEPPKNVKFFFATTEPHKIPQTILSRCQRFNLPRISQKALLQKLQTITKTLKIFIEEEALFQICDISEGSLRDAESLLDQLICYGKTPITLELTREVFGLVANQILFELDEAIHTKNLEKALQLARQIYESGKDINACIDSLLDHFRTYLLTHLNHDVPITYQKWAKKYSKNHCLHILDQLILWQQSALKTPFKQIHLEMLFLDLVRMQQKIPLETLVERLIILEGKMQDTPIAQINTPAKENIEIPQEKKSEEKKEPLPSKEKIHPSRYDTLVRFAAVELEGTVN